MKDQGFNSKNWVWVPDLDQVFVKGYIPEDQDINALKEDDEVDVIVTENNQESHQSYTKKDIELCNPTKFNKCNDMAELTHLNEPSVIYNLELRYNDDLIYTYSGLFLVAINPYKSLPIYDNTTLKKYHGHDYDKPPPHIFAIAEGTYRNLLLNKKNQSILVTGESGAGKTENTKKIIQYLSLITPLDVKVSNNNIDTKILQANPILESFGNAKTIKNNNSSRFGKFIKIYFTHQGTIDGATIDYYLLEKSRVVHQSSQERNYHIFYQFLKGSSDLKNWHLKNSLKDYKYLSSSKFDIPNVDDTKEFQGLIESFNIMGFSKFEIDNIFQILAIILHLGNLEFLSQTAEQANFTSDSPIKIIADLLGVDNNTLSTNLLKPKVKAGREFVSKSRKPAEVKYVIDAFAKYLYEKVFQYIIKKINDNLKNDSIDESLNSIGVLDIAGFEIFDVNSFEQLCINYTNEKLQQFFNHHSFILEQSEYLKENIQWEFIDFGQDLQPTIDLIETKKPMGILEILNEECMIPKSTDKTFVDKLAESWGNDKSKKFKQNKYKTGFIINHYAGVVEYNVDNWLQKNTDPISEHLLNMLPDSSNDFIRELFSNDEDEASRPQQAKKGGRVKTASVKHKEQLNNLMEQLGSTEPHFVRCILPNLFKKSNRFDKNLVLHQLRCNGVLEGIRITRAGYPNKLPFEEFFGRYSILNKDLVFTKNMKTNSEIILKNLDLEKDSYKVGITKIFFKNGILGQLEELRENYLQQIFIQFQSIVRGNNSRNDLKQKIKEIHASQLISKNLNQLNNSKKNLWFDLFINIKPLLEDSVKVLDSKEVNENLKKINGKLKDAENLKSLLEKENETLKSSISKLEDEVISTNNLMKEKTTKLEKIISEEKTSSKKLDELQRQLNEIKIVNDKLAKEKVDIDDKLNKSNDKITKHQSEFSELDQQYQSSLSQIKSLKSSLKELEQIKLEHDTAVTNLKKEFETSKATTTNESVKLRELNKSLTSQVNEHQSVIKQHDSLRKKSEGYEKELKALNVKLQQLVSENETIKRELKTITEKLAKLDTLVKQYEEDAQNRKREISQLQEDKAQISTQLDENNRIVQNYNKLKHDFDIISKKNFESNNEINELRTTLQQKEKDKENLPPNPSLMEEFAMIKLKLNEQSTVIRKEKFENKKLAEEVSILKKRLMRNNLNSSVNSSPTKDSRRSVALGEEVAIKNSFNEIESLKMKLEQEEANAIRAENYAIDLQKKLNKLQSTRGLNSYTDYEQKFKESQSRISELELRYEKLLSDNDFGSSGSSEIRPISRSDSFGSSSMLNGGSQDFIKIYQDITKTLKATREELNSSKSEILRLKSLLRESEDELYEVKRNNFKVSINDYEDELAQIKVKYDTLHVKNKDLIKTIELYKRRSDEYFKKLEMAESAVTISKRHEEQATNELIKFKNEFNLIKEELKTSTILVKDLRQKIHQKEEMVNDKKFEIQQLNIQIKNLEDKLSYINKNYGDNKELEDKFKTDIVQLNKELDFKLETENQLIKENKQLQLDYEELIENERNVRDQNEELLTKNDHLTEENEQLLNKLNFVEGELKISERKVSSFTKQISSLKNFNEELLKQKEELIETKLTIEKNLEEKTHECETLSHKLLDVESTCNLLRQHLDNQRLESQEIQQELNQSKIHTKTEVEDYSKLLKEKLVIKQENDSLKKINTELTTKVNSLEEKLYGNEQLKYWEEKVNSLTKELDENQGTSHQQQKKINNLERTIKNLEIRINNESQLTKKYNDENFNYQNQVGHYKSNIDILSHENEEKDLIIRANERKIDQMNESMLVIEQENLRLREQLGL